MNLTGSISCTGMFATSYRSTRRLQRRIVKGSEKNIVRAVIRDGEIHHLLPPEYHGDPLSAEGCLCFYDFGWELLEDLRAAGWARMAR